MPRQKLLAVQYGPVCDLQPLESEVTTFSVQYELVYDLTPFGY